MSDDKLRVSIGLPVFNGEDYLEEALDSILAQTYTDFELIISDNASTDRTEEICRAYAAKDRRIRYHRSERNLGAAKNFNGCFELSTGEYFKWAAHDDVLAPDYLLRCVEVLDQDPSVVLCHTKTKMINEHGKVTHNCVVKMNTMSNKPHERFRDMICVENWASQAFGVSRASALSMTPLIASYSNSDRNLLAELSLIGRVYEVPEYLFFQRTHPQQSGNMFPDTRERMAWFDPAVAGYPFPNWLRFRAYLSSIRRVPMSRYERIVCYKELGRCVILKILLRLKRKLNPHVDWSHVVVPINDNDMER